MMHACSVVMFLLCAGQLCAGQSDGNTGTCSRFCSNLGASSLTPGKSCADIYQVNKGSRGNSGVYWIINNSTRVPGPSQVYCDMELDCGGHKGGWMRVVDIDINGGDLCPTEWANVTVNSIHMCEPPSNTPGCYGTRFSVNGVNYTKVCGKARGYQKGMPGAFSGGRSIANGYADGLSITMQGPAADDQHRHVWTYAVGHDDFGDTRSRNCPCASFPGPDPNSFIRNDYYCESGRNSGPQLRDFYYTDDPLWDGNDCVSANNNCCAQVGMPWFFRQFPVEQHDDLVARLCQDEGFNNEGSPIDILQLYVQ